MEKIINYYLLLPLVFGFALAYVMKRNECSNLEKYKESKTDPETIKRLKEDFENLMQRYHRVNLKYKDLESEYVSFTIPADWVKLDLDLFLKNRSLLPHTLICRIDLFGDIYTHKDNEISFLTALEKNKPNKYGVSKNFPKPEDCGLEFFKVKKELEKDEIILEVIYPDYEYSKSFYRLSSIGRKTVESDNLYNAIEIITS